MADSANRFKNLADTEPRILHENLGISGHRMRNEVPLVTSKDLRRLAYWLFELYVKAHPDPRDVIVIDIDATDDPTHGQQQLSFFHGYYQEDMYHPEVQHKVTNNIRWISLAKIHPGIHTTTKATKIFLDSSINRFLNLAVGRARSPKYPIQNRFMKYPG